MMLTQGRTAHIFVDCAVGQPRAGPRAAKLMLCFKAGEPEVFCECDCRQAVCMAVSIKINCGVGPKAAKLMLCFKGGQPGLLASNLMAGPGPEPQSC
jgi:hypothetical protein